LDWAFCCGVLSSALLRIYCAPKLAILSHKVPLHQVEKRLDYYTRAQRLVEIPLLKEEWQKNQEDDKIWWNEKEAARIEMAIKKREYDISTRKRLLRMKDDKDAFVASIMSQKVGSIVT
jgi:hypothetical protein